MKKLTVYYASLTDIEGGIVTPTNLKCLRDPELKSSTENENSLIKRIRVTLSPDNCIRALNLVVGYDGLVFHIYKATVDVRDLYQPSSDKIGITGELWLLVETVFTKIDTIHITKDRLVKSKYDGAAIYSKYSEATDTSHDVIELDYDYEARQNPLYRLKTNIVTRFNDYCDNMDFEADTPED